MEHLKGLRQEILGFYESQPYEAAVVYNSNTGIYRLLLIKVTPPKEHWPVIVGEFLYDLRSALDHLVWQLAVRNGNTPPPFPLGKHSPWKRLQFPLFLNKHEFQHYAPAYLWGIRDEARRFIERVQPFDTPDHPLWLLSELSNIDKHRVLPLTSAYLHDVVLVPPRGIRMVTQYLAPAGFLQGKTEVARVLLVPPPKPPVGMRDCRAVIAIVFGQGLVPAEGLEVVNTLGRIGVETEKILKGLRPWLRPHS